MDLNDLKKMAPQTGLGQQPAADGGSPAPKSPKKLVIIIVAAVIGVSVLGAVGNYIMGKVVGFGARKAFEAGTGVKVDEQGGRVTFTGQDGTQVQYSGDEDSGTVTYKTETGEVGRIESQTGEGAKSLPKDFPSDFPLLSGAVLTSTWSMAAAEQGQNFNLVWTTDKSPEDVTAFFEGALPGQGWTRNMSSIFEDTTLLNFERSFGTDGGKDNAMFSVSKNDDGATEFSLTLTLPQR